MSLQVPAPLQKVVVLAAGAALTVSTTLLVKAAFRRRSDEDKENVYESQKLLSEYLVFHYGAPNDVLRYDFGPKDAIDFPKRCADICIEYFDPQVIMYI